MKRKNDMMLAHNVINMTNMCAKKEILSNIKKKGIDVIDLANEMQMSVDRFNMYMNNNMEDISVLMDILMMVKAWEG